MEFHPLAGMWALMDGEEYEAFKQSIADLGQLEPIVTFEGKILDGRNRYRACTDLGIEPQYAPFTGDDPIAFVLAQNNHRRHSTESQRAAAGALALTYIPIYGAEARQRRQEGRKKGGKTAGRGRGKPKPEEIACVPDGTQAIPESECNGAHRACDDAAAAAGSSSRSVARAKQVVDSGDEELVRLVVLGKVKVATATRIVEMEDEDREAVVEQIREGKKPAAAIKAVTEPEPKHWRMSDDAGKFTDLFDRLKKNWTLPQHREFIRRCLLDLADRLTPEEE